MIIKPGREQSRQFFECFLEGRVVIARFQVLRARARGDVADLDHGDFSAQEIWDREVLRLKLRTGELDPERHTKTVAFGSVESEVPDRIEIELARALLNIAPVTPNVEDILERKAGHLLHMLCERLAAVSGSQRWTVLLPGVADQPESRIAQRAVGGCGIEDGLPTLVLVNVKGALVEPLSDLDLPLGEFCTRESPRGQSACRGDCQNCT